MAADAKTKEMVAAYYCQKSPVYWAMLRRGLRGRLYRFWGDHPTEQRKFLEQPLNDTSQKKCAKKARQLGWSENSVTECLWFADTHPHCGVLYTLPTQKFCSDFSNTRIQPVIDGSEYLRAVCGGGLGAFGRKKMENVTLKQVGNSYLFIRTTGSETGGMGFPIDCAFWDEVDASNERNLQVFKAMLDASKYKFQREISTPTIPGKGVSYTYEKSDKKKWQVKCTKCGEWQFMKWPDSIGDFCGKKVFLCLKCHGVDCLDRANGRYVRQGSKDAEWSGYHVSQLEAPWFTAAEIYGKYEDSRYPQLFYNLVLGLEYVGDNVLLSEKDIDACIEDRITREAAASMKARGRVIHGIDWGDTTWGLTGVPVMVNGREKLLLTDIHKWDDPDINMHTRYIGMMIRMNNSALCLLDAGYGKAQNLTLLKEFPGDRVWACQYVNTVRGATARVVPVWTERQCRVTVQKDAQIKYYFQHYKDRSIVIPGYLKEDPHWDEFVKHSTSLVISRTEDNEQTGEIKETIEKTRDDHLAQAGVYLMTAFERITKNSARMAFV